MLDSESEHSCGCVIVRCCNRSENEVRGRSTIVATAGPGRMNAVGRTWSARAQRWLPTAGKWDGPFSENGDVKPVVDLFVVL